MSFYLFIFLVFLMAIVGNAIIFSYEAKCEKENKKSSSLFTLKVGAILIICFFCLVQFMIYQQNQDAKENSKPIYLNEKYYNNTGFVSVGTKELEKLKEENYVLYIRYVGLRTNKLDASIVKEYMQKHEMSFLIISYENFKNSYLNNRDKFFPELIIVKKGKIKKYIDYNSITPESFDTLEKFENWIEKYIINTRP